MKIPLEVRTRKLLFVSLSVLVVAGVMAYNIADEDTLPEQIENLHLIKPYDLKGLGLETWEVKGSTLHATYAGEGRSGWFSFRILETEDQARSWFAGARAALSDEREVQEINTFANLEYCASVGRATRCIGWDGNRTFEAFTSGTGFDRELDALLLTRTARKHWYRIYS